MREAKGNNLLRVHDLINGDRNEEHGEFADNLSQLASYMCLLTGRTYSREEARCFFIALKLCRVHDGCLGNDTLNDLVGYLALIKDDIDEFSQQPIPDRNEEEDHGKPIHGRQAGGEDGAHSKFSLGSLSREGTAADSIADGDLPGDGWIKNTAGECPCDSEAYVDVRLDDGTVYSDEQALSWHWGIANNKGDITHYRLSR